MTIYFPDIASFQKGISLDGALAVCAKITQGTGYFNPAYPEFRAEARSHGTYFTAYHFLTQGNGGAQAAHCFANAGSVPVMLDFEPDPPAGSEPTVADAEAFIDGYRTRGGTVHGMYLPQWYWVQLGRPSLAGLVQRGCWLWSSHYSPYTDSSSGAGWLSYGGMTPRVWQYSNTTPFNGHRIDFSAFHGSHPGDQSQAAITAVLAEFRSMMSTGTMPVTPVPVPVPPPSQPVPDTPQRMIADGQHSLHWYAQQYRTDWTEIMLVTAKAKPAGESWGLLQHHYLTDGNRFAPMPKGMIFYVGKP